MTSDHNLESGYHEVCIGTSEGCMWSVSLIS